MPFRLRPLLAWRWRPCAGAVLHREPNARRLVLCCRWVRTDEPFFVEEEKEKRLDSLFEADVEVRSKVAVLHRDRVDE